MKNLNVLITVGFLCAIALHGCCDRKSQKDEETQEIMYIENKELSSKDYANAIGNMPADGLIPTKEIAVQIAEIVLSKIYGHERIEQQKPFFINLEDDVWIIEGYFNRHEGGVATTDGGVAYMEISKRNGTILKLLHSK
jgi:hypothetical protein